MTKRVNSQDLTVVSEVKLLYKNRVPASQRRKVTSSHEAIEIFLAHWDRDQIDYVEEFKVLALNRANKAIALTTVSQGGISGTVVDPKIIFQFALKSCASSIILAHNHPSGNSQPSHADVQLTKKLKSAGEYLEIPVLDHLIITSENSCYSFADEGLL